MQQEDEEDEASLTKPTQRRKGTLDSQGGDIRWLARYGNLLDITILAFDFDCFLNLFSFPLPFSISFLAIDSHFVGN